MAEHDVDSIPTLIRNLLDDTRDLIREEIALARVEIRDEMTAARTVGIAFGSAAFTALIGAAVLAIALGGAISYFLNWPTWAGYGIMAIVLLIAALAVVQYGRGRLAKLHGLPKTTQTVKENVAWIQSKSAGK